jgi:hypothetical protein
MGASWMRRCESVASLPLLCFSLRRLNRDGCGLVDVPMMQCARTRWFEYDQRRALAAPFARGVRRVGNRAGKWAHVVL